MKQVLKKKKRKKKNSINLIAMVVYLSRKYLILKIFGWTESLSPSLDPVAVLLNQ